MDTKHTPAPWKVYANRKHAKSGTYIFQVRGGGVGYIAAETFGGSFAEAEANAKIIAAAPELLEALVELFEQCSMVHKYWGDGSNQKESDSAIANARAAIAKAVS